VTKPLKRVLLYYVRRPPIMAHLANAFARRGIETCLADAHANHPMDKVFHVINKQLHNFRILPKTRSLFCDHPYAQRNYREKCLLESARAFQPDLVIALRGLFGIQEQTFAALRAMAPVFSWWIEGDDRVAQAEFEARRADYFFCMHRSLCAGFQGAGLSRVDYLPHGVDTDVFHTAGDIDRRYDLSFVGKWSAARQKILEAAYEVTPNIAVAGGLWEKRWRFQPKLRKMVVAAQLYGEALTRLYQQSRVVLNYTNWGDRQRSGFTMRVLEVPACGTLLLTDPSSDLAEFVTPGKHVAVFKDDAQCLHLLQHYLVNDAERERMSSEAAAHVAQRFSYDHHVARFRTAWEQLTCRERA